MNKYKNKNYKSALQYFNTVPQTVAATTTAIAPYIVDLGGTVTDTGCAFDFKGRSFDVDYSGLYHFGNTISLAGTATGILAVAITLDGIPLPETNKLVTVGAGVVTDIYIDTRRALKTCCGISNHTIGLAIYSTDATGAATITNISGNALKLA